MDENKNSYLKESRKNILMEMLEEYDKLKEIKDLPHLNWDNTLSSLVDNYLEELFADDSDEKLALVEELLQKGYEKVFSRGDCFSYELWYNREKGGKVYVDDEDVIICTENKNWISTTIKELLEGDKDFI